MTTDANVDSESLCRYCGRPDHYSVACDFSRLPLTEAASLRIGGGAHLEHEMRQVIAAYQSGRVDGWERQVAEKTLRRLKGMLDNALS